MLQKNLTHGEVSLALYHWLVSFVCSSLGPHPLMTSDKRDELYDTKFPTLLKKMSEIKPNREYMIEYLGMNEPLEIGYTKLFPSMRITVHSNYLLKAVYKLVVKKQAREEILSVKDGEYVIFSSPIEKMLHIQDDEKIPSEPIKFDLPKREPPVDKFEEFLHSVL